MSASAWPRVSSQAVAEGALILNAGLTRWVLASAELEVIDPFDALSAPVVDLSLICCTTGMSRTSRRWTSG
jgi:hypothetical protein